MVANLSDVFCSHTLIIVASNSRRQRQYNMKQPLIAFGLKKDLKPRSYSQHIVTHRSTSQGIQVYVLLSNAAAGTV